VKNKELLLTLTREMRCKLDLLREFSDGNDFINNSIQYAYDYIYEIESAVNEDIVQ
jgi:hypothetical protein